MAQVALQTFFSNTADASSVDIASVDPDAGEGILVGVLLDATDTDKEVLSVQFDPTGDNDTFPIADRLAFSPSDGKVRVELWVIGSGQITTAQTETVRVTLEGHSFSRPPTSANAEDVRVASRLKTCRCMERVHIGRRRLES